MPADELIARMAPAMRAALRPPRVAGRRDLFDDCEVRLEGCRQSVQHAGRRLRWCEPCQLVSFGPCELVSHPHREPDRSAPPGDLVQARLWRSGFRFTAEARSRVLAR